MSVIVRVKMILVDTPIGTRWDLVPPLPHWQRIDGDYATWNLVYLFDHPPGWDEHPQHVRNSIMPVSSELIDGHVAAIKYAQDSPELTMHTVEQAQDKHARLIKRLAAHHVAAITDTGFEAIQSLHSYFDKRYRPHPWFGKYRLEFA